MVFVLGLRSPRAGEYAADFLRIGVGARALAMGGAYTAMVNDATAFYWNPAGLTKIRRFGLHFDHVPLFGGLSQFNSASILLSFDRGMAFSLGWMRLGVDDIPRYGPLQGTKFDRLVSGQYRSTGQADGTFKDTEDAIMVSFARTEFFDIYFGGGFSGLVLPAELSIGLTGKLLRQTLDSASGTGQGLDAGAVLRFVSRQQSDGEPDQWLGIGAIARDLSRTRIIWDTHSKHRDNRQSGLQAGVAASKYLRPFRSRITVEFDKEFGFYDDIHIGGEMKFFNIIAIRGGMNDGHFSAGAGLSVMGLRIDYAFVSGELANTHRVSGAFYF